MKKYLIEVTHEADKKACEEAIRIFLNTGSHFMTNAGWGCMDGEHKAWIILDLENKSEALNILPPGIRRNARIIELPRFTMDRMGEIEGLHG